MGLLGIGSGLFISPNSGVTLDSVPQDKTGAASGLLYCMAFLGSAIGTAFSAALLSSSLHSHGGLAALHGGPSQIMAIRAFVGAQDFVFHALLVASGCGAILCALRHSKPPSVQHP
jgi:hypothetical protein